MHHFTNQIQHVHGITFYLKLITKFLWINKFIDIKTNIQLTGMSFLYFSGPQFMQITDSVMPPPTSVVIFQ